MFGGSLGDNVLVHGAGLAALVKKRGPPISSDSFDWAVIMDSHMCIVRIFLVLLLDCLFTNENYSGGKGGKCNPSPKRLLFS